MNANSRKWADRPLFWPIFMLFVVIPPFSALRGPLSTFRPRTSNFQTSATPPAQLRLIFSSGTPFRGRFRVQKTSARHHLRDRRYVAPQDRHKADLARILALFACTQFPEPAARCAVDPPPHFRYPFANQEKSPRHVKPTSGWPNKTVRRKK